MGVFRADNIQTPFLKLSIAKQRDLNGDGRETIAGCGPALPHPPTPYHRSHLVVQLFFYFSRCPSGIALVFFPLSPPYLSFSSLESFLPLCQPDLAISHYSVSLRSLYTPLAEDCNDPLAL